MSTNNQHFYNVWDEKVSFFRGFPKGDIYSWFKGNIYPDDMKTKVLRKEDLKICLFNNSASSEDKNECMFEIKELTIW